LDPVGGGGSGKYRREVSPLLKRSGGERHRCPIFLREKKTPHLNVKDRGIRMERLSGATIPPLAPKEKTLVLRVRGIPVDKNPWNVRSTSPTFIPITSKTEYKRFSLFETDFC